jgi:hypothetical protein
MASYPTQSIPPGDWVDVVDTNSSLASIAVTLQNVGGTEIRVYEAGVSAPTGDDDGIVLEHGIMDSGAAVNVNAANVWVRSVNGTGAVAFTDTK